MLGDLILTLPLIKSLKDANNATLIDIVVQQKFHSFARSLPWIHNVIPVNNDLRDYRVIGKLRKNKYDIAIDCIPGSTYYSSLLLASIRAKKKVGYAVGIRKFFLDTKVHAKSLQYETELVLELARSIGYKASHNLILPIPAKDEDYIKRWLKKNKIQKVAVLCPGGISKTRRWPSERFARVADSITKSKWKVIISGSENEKKISKMIQYHMNSEAIDMTGVLSITRLCALIKYADLVITNNSAPMHIAAAFNTPQIVLSGPSSPIRWDPKNKNAIIIRKTTQFEEELRKSTCGDDSIMKIETEEVIAAVNKII